MIEKIEIFNTKNVSKSETINSGIVFKALDVLGNTIVLKESTLQSHIAGESGDHPERHYLNFETNLNRVKKILEDPTQILEDKNNKNRYNYIATTAFESQKTIKGVKIVTEEVETNHHEVVTIFSTQSIKESVEGRVVYDRYSS